MPSLIPAPMRRTIQGKGTKETAAPAFKRMFGTGKVDRKADKYKK
jgi:hypothetical protein